MKYYAIRNKKTEELLRYDYTSNPDPEDCVGESYYFTEDNSDRVWLISNKEIAEKALNTNTEWYNGGYESPSHSKKINKEDYEIVRVEIVVTKVLNLERKET